jgi:hypothetical protein
MVAPFRRGGDRRWSTFTSMSIPFPRDESRAGLAQGRLETKMVEGAWSAARSRSPAAMTSLANARSYLLTTNAVTIPNMP